MGRAPRAEGRGRPQLPSLAPAGDFPVPVLVPQNYCVLAKLRDFVASPQCRRLAQVDALKDKVRKLYTIMNSFCRRVRDASKALSRVFSAEASRRGRSGAEGGTQGEEKPFLTHCHPGCVTGTRDKAPRLHDVRGQMLLIQDRPRQVPGGQGSGERASRGQRGSVEEGASAGPGVGRFW